MSVTVTLSAADRLSLSADGPIPDRLWNAARAIDRAQAAKRTTRRGRIKVG